MTAVAEANAYATQQAIEDSWNAYFQLINGTLASSASELPGVFIDPAYFLPYPSQPQIPWGYSRGASYPAVIGVGSGVTWVALTFFASSAEADAALADMHGGLLRSGWQSEDVDGLDHNHSCLTLVIAETSEAACYMTRDDALIVSYSTIPADAREAALLNAVDLARLMNDAYNAVEQPE